MITDVKDKDKIKVGYWIVNVDSPRCINEDDTPLHRARQIVSIETVADKTNYMFNGGTTINDLFEYADLIDYVCEDYQEVINNFAEYFI
jgi:hypothetical protein